MFIVGDDYWGKVDWVPGLFYVKTRFLHIWWFPIVPRESYLFLDENPLASPPRGYRIPLRWKSVGIAWLQAFLLVEVVSLLGVGCAFCTMDLKGRHVSPYVLAGAAWLMAILSAGLYWWSCQWMSPTLSRAIDLGNVLGISPDTVELQFKIAR